MAHYNDVSYPDASGQDFEQLVSFVVSPLFAGQELILVVYQQLNCVLSISRNRRIGKRALVQPPLVDESEDQTVTDIYTVAMEVREMIDLIIQHLPLISSSVQFERLD